MLATVRRASCHPRIRWLSTKGASSSATATTTTVPARTTATSSETPSAAASTTKTTTTTTTTATTTTTTTTATTTTATKATSPEPAASFLESGLAHTCRTFTAGDVQAFGELTGDLNPIHVDPKAAARFGFERCIVHGALLNGLVSGLIASSLSHCVVLEQTLNFPRPLPVGDTVTVTLELVEQRKRFVSVKYTCCHDPLKYVVMDGHARLALSVEKNSPPALSN